jgi:hypothetical protein
MDLSKLPNMRGGRDASDAPHNTSATPDEHPDGPPIYPAQPIEHARDRRPGGFAEAWLGVAIGVIILLMSPRLFHYLLRPGSFAQSHTFTAPDGSPLTYPQTVFFLGDLVVVAFGLTLIVEGLVLGFARSAIWVTLAIGFTALVAAANGAYLGYMMFAGYGIQLYSAIAVALGVYACMILAQRRRELLGQP